MKKRIIITALLTIGVGCSAIGLAACNTKPEGHKHNWSTWAVSEENKPTLTETGKATRSCNAAGCEATTNDKEYVLPLLSSADYTITNNTATCENAGMADYVYGKNNVNVSFTAATVAKGHAYGNYVNTDADGHYKVCDNDNAHKTEKENHNADGTDGGCSVCGYKATSDDDHHWGAWTVTTENTPTRVLPGKAVRACTDTDCNETDEIELPPLANTSDYTLTNNTADCENGGTATYTYKDGNNTVIFTAATVAKGHSYGEVEIVNGVPKQTCGTCHTELPAQSSATLNGSGSVKFYAGGNLGEFTVTANSGAIGYYTYTYEGETEITVAYQYYSMRDGEVSDTVRLSASKRTQITVYLETRATCTMKITSASAEAFVGEISSEFSDKDPSYVTPTLSLGVTTVSTTYEGVAYEFTAPVTGSYTLSCENAAAVVLYNDNALTLPHTFNMVKDETISFVMCCNDETVEYDVKVDLNMQGSGTYSDPYIITEDMLAVKIGTILKNGETKYYKIDMVGEFILNCLPLETEGTYPTFVSDVYTAENYTAEKIVGEERITVSGWKVKRIESNESFIFALTGSGSNATDDVELYVNYVYGSKQNPYNWDYIYMYCTYVDNGFGLGDTVYIDLYPTVTGRITLEFVHISTVKMGGVTKTTDGLPFEMFVVAGEKYSLECTTSYMINGEVRERVSYSIQVSSSGNAMTVLGGGSLTSVYENDFLVWWNYSAGTSENPHKTSSLVINKTGAFRLFAEANTYVRITDKSYVTFTFGSGVTATCNGKEILSGVRYSFAARDIVEFVNSGEEGTVSYVSAESIGEANNPLLLYERESDSLTVEANSSYYIQAKGAFEMSFTFTGVTVKWNGTVIDSGKTYTAALGDEIVLINNSNSNVSVEYVTLALFGTRYNPDTLEVETAKEITAETYFNLTISGDGSYQITVSDLASAAVTVNGVSNVTLGATSDEYALYGVIIQYNNRYYAFNADGILCKVGENKEGTASQTTAIHYGGSMDGNAYVAPIDCEPLVLTAGTYLIRVLKNSGTSTVLDGMSIGCTITVVEAIVEIPPDEGTLVAVEGSNTGVTTENDVDDGEEYVKCYVYNVTSNGTLIFSSSDSDTVLSAVKGATINFDAAMEFPTNQYIIDGVADSFELTVKAGDIVSIIVGNINGTGEYSFDMSFNKLEPIGSIEDPKVVVEGSNIGVTTENDVDDGEEYVKCYVYNVRSNGTLIFSSSDSDTVLSAVKGATINFDAAMEFPTNQYIIDGVADSFELTVKAGDIVSIIVGNINGTGEYSFTMTVS